MKRTLLLIFFVSAGLFVFPQEKNELTAKERFELMVDYRKPDSNSQLKKMDSLVKKEVVDYEIVMAREGSNKNSEKSTKVDQYVKNEEVRMAVPEPLEPALLSSSLILPSIYSLYKYFPYVGDQKGINACSAWAAAELLAIEKNIANGVSYTDKTEIRNYPDKAYSPSYIFTLAKNVEDADPDCKVGFDLKNAMEILKYRGVPSLKDCPYFRNNFNCVAVITSAINESATHNVIPDYRPVALHIDDFQNALSHNCPIAIEVCIDEDFLRNGLDEKWNNTHPFIWSAYGSSTDRSERKLHSMVCIGYNDNLGAFEMIDSHGAKFWNNGVFWIDYKFMFEIVITAYRIKCKAYDEKIKEDTKQAKVINDKIETKGIQKSLFLNKMDSKKAFDLYWSAPSFDFGPNNKIAYIKVKRSERVVVRKSIPVGLKMAKYFTIGNDKYLIQLLKIRKNNPNQHSVWPKEEGVDILITKFNQN